MHTEEWRAACPLSKPNEGDIFPFVGLAYQGKDIVVFRFIIDNSSLRDFGP
jgi:hypothetical protein